LAARRQIVNAAAEQLKERSLRLALATTRLCRTFPVNWEGQHVADQLFRSVTSTAANYSAACRARSTREFIAKLGLVIEEADETVFWLRFSIRASLKQGNEASDLLKEARELLAIFLASARTATSNYRLNREATTNHR
jgi:four helix bundle protein